MAKLSPFSSFRKAAFEVLDAHARVLGGFVISAELETFPVSQLKGVYYYRVIKEGKVVKTGRFVVE